MKLKRLIPWLWIIVVGVMSLAVIWPLFHAGFFQSDDGEWMVIRLSAFYQSLSSGQFPVRFLGRLNNNYGYPVANFLYPGFLYIGSVLRLVGVSFPDGVKVIMGVSVVGSAIFMYLALRRRFQVLSSIIGTMSFLYAPYLSYDLYRRGSVGEVLAMLPASLMLYAISAGASWLLPPAIAFLIVSHNTTALIMGIAIGALVIADKRPYAYVWHAVLGIGLSAFFWLPAILEQTFVKFNQVIVSDPSQYFISFQNLALLSMPTVISMVLLVSLRTKKAVSDIALVILIVCGYLLCLPLSSILWHGTALAKVVQFPYRFLMVPLLLGPWVVAKVLDSLHGWKVIALIAVFGCFWLPSLISLGTSVVFVSRPIGYYTTNEATTTVADEYMPRWVSEVPKHRTVDVLDVVSGDANLSTRRFSKESIQVTVDAKKESVVVINKIYYPGWGVIVDNVPVPIDYQNSFGFMRITIPTGIHEMRAAFRETPQRFFIDIISAASFICYLVFFKRLSKNT